MGQTKDSRDRWTIKRPTNSPKTHFKHKRAGDSVGVCYDNFLEAAELVQEGIRVSAVMRLHETSGLTLERIKEVTGISEGTFARRKETGRFSQEESERLLRVSRVFEKAMGLFDGSAIDALEWLETPIAVLGDQRPLDLSRSEPGAREVEDLIGRIEHGVVS